MAVGTPAESSVLPVLSVNNHNHPSDLWSQRVWWRNEEEEHIHICESVDLNFSGVLLEQTDKQSHFTVLPLLCTVIQCKN